MTDIQARGTTDTGPALDALQAALARAQRALEQYMAPDVQEAIGDTALWAAGLRERRETRDRAAEALGRRTRRTGRRGVPDVATLRDVWENGTTAERRELLAARFDCFAAVPRSRRAGRVPDRDGAGRAAASGLQGRAGACAVPGAPRQRPGTGRRLAVNSTADGTVSLSSIISATPCWWTTSRPSAS